MGCSRKKQTGVWGYEISSGIEETASGFSEDKLKNNLEFLVVLVLGLKISESCNTVLWSFYGWSPILAPISRGKVKNLKIPGVFSK